MSDAPVPTRRLRTFATSKPVVAGLVLLLIYAAAGFLLAPWLVKQQLPGLVDRHLGAQGSVSTVRINPFLLTFEVTGLTVAEKNAAPALQIGRLFVDFEAGSLWRRAWTFREIRIEQPVINAELDAGENLNLARLLSPARTNAPPAPQTAATSAPPRLLLQHFVISGGTFSFADHTLQPAARARFNPVHFEMHDVSTLPDHHGEHVLTARLPGGGSLQWQGKFTLTPIVTSGSITLKNAKLATLWQFVQDHLAIAEPGGSYELGLRYSLRYGNGALDLQADDLALRMQDIAITRPQGGATLGQLKTLAFDGGRFDLQKRSLSFKDARMADGVINVILDQDGQPDWAKLVRSSPAAAKPDATPAAPPATNTTAAAPWQITLPQVSIGPLALAVTDHSRVQPLRVTVAGAHAGFGMVATVGQDTQVVVDSGTLNIRDTRIHSGTSREPLIALTAVEFADGAFDLRQKTIRAGLLRLSGGKTQVTRGADGALELAAAFAARRDEPSPDSGFSVALDRAELADHAVVLADHSLQPAMAYDLEHIRIAISKIAMPFRGPSPLELGLRIKQGGVLQAKGTVDPLKQTADIRFEAADVALAPVGGLLKRHTTLTLASGKAGADGRVIWNGKTNPAALRYAGTAAISDIELKTESSGERLLGWQRIVATDIDFDAAGNRLAIAQLGIARPYARLIINKDRSTNLAGIVRPSSPPSDAAPAPASGTSAPLAISLERISMERGEMDFSDLSLVLPFAVRIQALGGSVSGLSSAADARASLKLEGRVDEFGLARAEGALQPFTPKKFTDIAVTFRNIALTSLSPYTATFAGRRIASGKLSLDLQYKLDNSQLAGDNKMLLEQFTLGERVESPTAINLPLDLAIALLTDSDGKIDLAVPVSGNVDSPEFSYGHVIWQAIRTVITRIVTAPFRALGALFGGNAETLGDIVFDPGSARILPTEYEKLRRVAEGLQKRPQLKLLVQGLFHADSDGRALRTQAVRADLATREGLKLAPGEDPGPVGYDSAKTQRALENMLDTRAGGNAAAQFVEAFRKTAGREVSRVNPVLAVMGRGAGDHALYVALHQKLIELQPLPAPALTELATARAHAITRAFTTRLKFDPARLGSKPVAASEETAQNGVPVKLSFEPIQ